MKKRRLLYISLVLLLAGCAKEADLSNTQTSEEKTPLLINATLSTGRAQTRASGNEFSTGDQLKVYLRHTTGGTLGNYNYLTPSSTDYANKLVTFTKEASGFTSTAYWDDFSDPNSADTNIRTTGHGLHSYYSYCYNGGTPSTALTEGTSVLGWTVQTDQSSEAFYRKSDILWSPEQETVQYFHSTAHSGAGINHGTIELPFTHAMSQITVTVTAADGFDGFTTTPLTNTVLTLNNMHTVSTLTARTSNWVDVPGDANANVKPITMYGAPYTSGLTRNYTAIVAPETKLKVDEKLLDVVNADGNNYTLDITSAMLDNDTGWGKDHAAPKQGEEDGKKYVITQPGYNYHLDLTINKSAVQGHATLTGWTDVNASGTGEIVLTDNDTNLVMDDEAVSGITDIDVVAVDKNEFKSGSRFSLFRTSGTRTNDGYEFATISTFYDNEGEANDQWNNNPAIYWPNVTTSYYYRALAKFNSPDSEGTYAGKNNIESVGTIDPLAKATTVSQGTIAGGNDILWGTTPQHKGYSNTTYERGVAIPPRKGGVPIAFEHAMSKIAFTIETTNVVLTQVDLKNAAFNISNIYTNGNITIDNGNIATTGDLAASTLTANADNEETTSKALFTEQIVVPQTFRDDAKVNITLANNATYSIPLKDCVVSGGTTPITAWERGKNYTYTIHVEKERVQAHVLVKDWDAVAGSGTATLDW